MGYNIGMENNEQTSKNGGWIFLLILILLILGLVVFAYWSIVVERGYQIVSEVYCDPAEESCFYYEGVVCDDPSDTECVPEEAYDYKIISKKAAAIYACEQTEEKIDCGEELSCLENEANCEYTNCDPDNLGEGEICSETPTEEPEEELITGEDGAELPDEATTTDEINEQAEEPVLE